MAYKKLIGNDLLIAEVLEKTIIKLMNEKNIKTQEELRRKIYEKVGFTFTQPALSELLNHRKKANVNELIALSDFFNVSIDFLLGRENNLTELTVAEACSFIIKLQESKLNMEYKNITVEELSKHSTYNHTYKALYFSEVEKEFLPFETNINIGYKKAYLINLFIEKVLRLNLTRNDIDNDIYNEIISKWINKLKYFDDETLFENDDYLCEF